MLSFNTLHNLHNYDLYESLKELERVGKKYLVVESYRTEKENEFLYWQVTCEAFCTPEEWKWWSKKLNILAIILLYILNEK